jgi:uncharacterized DUF497 family protein
MDDKERQIDEMGASREAQYALECVLVRLTEAELQRVIDDLPPRPWTHQGDHGAQDKAPRRVAPLPGQGILRGFPTLYHDAMKITPTPHAHRRMRERSVTVADIRNVLNSRPQMHFSPNKRVHTGRALDGRRLEVMYTEAKAGEVRIVSVRAAP